MDAGWLVICGGELTVAVAVLESMLPAALLAYEVVRIDIDDPALCLRLFKLNREVGLAVGLALLLGRI